MASVEPPVAGASARECRGSPQASAEVKRAYREEWTKVSSAELGSGIGISTMKICGYDQLARHVVQSPARLGAIRLVAIDGPSGAGKSFFSHNLSNAFTAVGVRSVLVHTDDLLDGWGDQLTFWPKLETCVLIPLREGRSGGFWAYDWLVGARGSTWVSVEPAPIVILEGMSVARAEIRQELTLAVFVDAPLAVRRARVISRDGPWICSHLWIDGGLWRGISTEVMIRPRMPT